MKILFLFLSLSSLLLFGCGKSLSQEELDKKNVENCFLPNGISKALNESFQKTLHNPKSLEIVSASHKFISKKNTDVSVSYRSNNQLGEPVLNSISYKMGSDCQGYRNSIVENGVKIEFDSKYSTPPL